jgi:hypothetical protein
MQQSGPRTPVTCWLGSPCAGCSTTGMCSGSPDQQSGSGTPAAHRLGSPELAAATVPGSLFQQVGAKAPTTQRLGPLCLKHLLWLLVAWCQQAGLRALATCRLKFPMPTAAAMAPGSPCPNASRPHGLPCLWAPGDSSWLALLPHRHPQLATQSQEPAITHLRKPQAAGFAILMVPGGFLLHTAQRTSLPTVLDSKRTLTLLSKNGKPDSPLRIGKL